VQEEDLCTQLFSALRPKPPLLSHHMVVHRSVPASMGKAEAAAEAEAAEVEDMQSKITGHMVDRAPMLQHVICQNNPLCQDIAQSSNCNGMMIAFDMPIGKLKNTCFTE